MISSVRARIQSSQPEIGLGFTVLERQIENSLRRERLMAALGLLWCDCGATGYCRFIWNDLLHGHQADDEIGIRMALELGATRLFAWSCGKRVWLP